MDTTINQSAQQTLPDNNPSKKRKVFYIGVSVALLIVIGLVSLFFLENTKQEHLIPGVPYWGAYRGSEITTDGAFVIYSLLQYWGDSRFDTKEIADVFPFNLTSDAQDISYVSIADFFRSIGYKVNIVRAEDSSFIKSNINNNIPVVLVQKIDDTIPDYVVPTMRVIIGYSDKNKIFTAHDNAVFGNNYEISYKMFNNLRTSPNILIIEPEEEALSYIDGPDLTRSYPERLSIMNSESMQEIQKNFIAVGTLRLQRARTGSNTSSQQIVDLWEKILAEPDFGNLHPAARMLASFNLAKEYTNILNEHEQSITILETITMPLLSIDFSQPFGDWERLQPEIYDNLRWYTRPYITLGLSYARIGDLEKAQEAFESALGRDPTNGEARAWLTGVSSAAIESIVSSQNKSNVDTTQVLINNSPWIGRWGLLTTGNVGYTSGEFELSFKQENNGIITGIINTEVGNSNIYDKISHIEVEKNLVRFKSPTNSWYELTIEGQGIFSGFAYRKINPEFISVARVSLQAQ